MVTCDCLGGVTRFEQSGQWSRPIFASESRKAFGAIGVALVLSIFRSAECHLREPGQARSEYLRILYCASTSGN
jgi:hypothetical protein